MRVGYLLPEKKAQILGLLDGVRQRLQYWNIDVVAINDQLPLEQQGPFQMIIHKLSDYQRDAENGDSTSIKIIEEMCRYEKNHASTCIFIDSISMVFQLANRATMSQICEKATFSLNNYCVYVPPWIQIDSKEQIPNILPLLSSKGVTYPILCKALNAAEGPGAHDMQLIFNEYQLLNELQVVPCIAQSFVNHDRKMCKIFVVGSSWCIVNRPSIRNFKDNFDITPPTLHQPIHQNHNCYTNGYSSSSSIRLDGQLTKSTDFLYRSIVFNSHEVSKPDSVSFLNKYAKRYQQHVSYGNNELLDDNVVNELIKRLQKVIPFTLMGIDIIVNGSNYGLIDINFLPGYDGMSNFYDELYNLIVSKLKIYHYNQSSQTNGINSSNPSSIGGDSYL